MNCFLRRHLKPKQNVENERMKYYLLMENVKNVLLCLYAVSEGIEMRRY